MITLFILLIIQAIHPMFSLLILLASKSLWAQQQCLSFISTQNSYQFLLDAILCGKNHIPYEYKNLLQAHLILHIFVISGLHIHLIEKGLHKVLSGWCPYYKPFTYALLTLYAFFCHWNPPIIRALFYSILRNLSQHFKWGWNSYDTLLYTGLIALILHPQWLTQFSFALSWLAALGILYANKKEKIIVSLTVYFLILPLTFSWGPSSPLQIIGQLLLTPLVFIGLIIQLFSLLIPLLQSFSELVWNVFFFFSQHLTKIYPTLPSQFLPIQPLHLWIYILITHAILRNYQTQLPTKIKSTRLKKFNLNGAKLP